MKTIPNQYDFKRKLIDLKGYPHHADPRHDNCVIQQTAQQCNRPTVTAFLTKIATEADVCFYKKNSDLTKRNITQRDEVQVQHQETQADK